MKKIRIGTRGSDLALWQANTVSNKLSEAGFPSEIRIIKTTGDRRQDVPLASIGGKGLFIKEIEEALDSGSIDIAVHSLKDVPSIVPPRFRLGAFLERADPRDAWLQPDFRAIETLSKGAKVATSSPRRRAQVKRLHPQVELDEIRGNVDTRIRKMHSGLCDGMILAAAGLTRLGRDSEIVSFFPVDQMVPAAGQGIVAIETCAGRDDLLPALEAIDHADSHLAAESERGVLQRFGTLLDCYSCIAVHARTEDGTLQIDAFLSDPSGEQALRLKRFGARDDASAIVNAVADELIAQGAYELLGIEPAP
ncbi:MAG: hydroxymethylbilane synthase [Thermoanaerobaculia bacterium]